jgi:hypothetical protein
MKSFYKTKQWRPLTKQKEEKRKKHKPEEQEGMPQHQHSRRGDRNPECHDEQQRDVA